MRSETMSDNRGQAGRKAATDSKCGIESIFLPQISDMHGIEEEGGGGRECGRAWTVDPAYGRGSYWCLAIDDTAAIAVFDLLFSEAVSFGAVVPNFFCFGSYGRSMIPYFTPLLGIEDGWETGTLLGYAWRAGMCREVVPPGERLTVASISLLPEGATRMARAIGADPVLLTAAIARLDGAPQMRAVDRTSFNLACAFAREHLEDPIELEDLCRVACTSPSKLASLFRDAEGTTPMGWVRDRRMERACELLAGTDEPIAAVSASVGFSRQGSFSEAFKERFGVTPNRYRMLNQNR